MNAVAARAIIIAREISLGVSKPKIVKVRSRTIPAAITIAKANPKTNSFAAFNIQLQRHVMTRVRTLVAQEF